MWWAGVRTAGSQHPSASGLCSSAGVLLSAQPHDKMPQPGLMAAVGLLTTVGAGGPRLRCLQAGLRGAPPSAWFTDGHLPAVCSHARDRQRSLVACSGETSSLWDQGFPLRPHHLHHLLQAPSPNTIPLGLGLPPAGTRSSPCGGRTPHSKTALCRTWGAGEKLSGQAPLFCMALGRLGPSTHQEVLFPFPPTSLWSQPASMATSLPTPPWAVGRLLTAVSPPSGFCRGPQTHQTLRPVSH